MVVLFSSFCAIALFLVFSRLCSSVCLIWACVHLCAAECEGACNRSSLFIKRLLDHLCVCQKDSPLPCLLISYKLDTSVRGSAFSDMNICRVITKVVDNLFLKVNASCLCTTLFSGVVRAIWLPGYIKITQHQPTDLPLLSKPFLINVVLVPSFIVSPFISSEFIAWLYKMLRNSMIKA